MKPGYGCLLRLGPGASACGRRRQRLMSQALLALSALLANALAWAGCDLKQMDIPVRIVDQRPIATLTLNGTAVPLLVDSGAFFSMLSESTATQLKLPLHRLPKGMSI